MKATGIKLVCERKDGAITTWHDTANESVETIINNIKYSKNWVGGKITKAYMEFSDSGKYYKLHIDIKEQQLNNLLKK